MFVPAGCRRATISGEKMLMVESAIKTACTHMPYHGIYGPDVQVLHAALLLERTIFSELAKQEET